MRYFRLIFLACCLAFSFGGMAQGQVFILHADSLKGSAEIKDLMGHVQLQQGNTTLSCQQAVINTLTNNVMAYGRVKIIQADTVVITGDTASYQGDMRRAIMFGKVKLDDGTIQLFTNKLDYDLNTKMAIYEQGARILDKKTVLRSKQGFYSTQTKQFLFKGNVDVKDQDGGRLRADSLRYNTQSKEAFFICPTTIIDKKDTVLTSKGFYNTQNKISRFTGRSKARLEDMDLTADTLFYDGPTKIGVANGRVEFYSKKDKVLLTGEHGRYNGNTGISRVYERALMQHFLEKDTLLLHADTLVSIEQKKDSIRQLYAYKNVQIYKSDFSGKCDSLAYSSLDSVIHFYQKPLLWTKDSQIQADSISLIMRNQAAEEMRLRGRSFVIAQDSLGQFNQIKGRKMWVFFGPESRLEKVNVEGNGESVYFVVDDKKKTTGLNRVECSRMQLIFKENKVQRISFFTKPEAKFAPPKEWKEEWKTLDGFQWRIKEKIKKSSLLDYLRPGLLVKKP